MEGLELITLISNNLPSTINSVVPAIAGGIITAIFLRNNTSTEEFEKIKAGELREVTNDLLKSGKMTYTEFYKANNFLTVAEKADKYYKEERDSSKEKEYDFDWFIRFYEAVGNISNEEMQELWARILAGEICKPSTFSLKTIDALKNITKKDADLFSTICKYSIKNINEYFLPRYDEYLNKVHISYSDIMHLYELGLIYNDGSIVYKIAPSQKSILFATDNLLISHESKKEYSINQYPLTETGNELANITDSRISDEDFINFARIVKNKNTSVTIKVHRIIKFDGNGYSFEENDILSEN